MNKLIWTETQVLGKPNYSATVERGLYRLDLLVVDNRNSNYSIAAKLSLGEDRLVKLAAKSSTYSGDLNTAKRECKFLSEVVIDEICSNLKSSYDGF